MNVLVRGARHAGHGGRAVRAGRRGHAAAAHAARAGRRALRLHLPEPLRLRHLQPQARTPPRRVRT